MCIYIGTAGEYTTSPPTMAHSAQRLRLLPFFQTRDGVSLTIISADGADAVVGIFVGDGNATKDGNVAGDGNVVLIGVSLDIS